MNWIVKAVTGQVLSYAPAGRRLHEFVQRHVTRSLPLPEADFRTRVSSGCQHLRAYARFGKRPLADSTFFEFGAGWDLTVPLVRTFAGVKRQTLFDLTPLARADLVSNSLERLRALPTHELVELDSGATLTAARFPDRGPTSQQNLHEWLAGIGIDYVAPGDARATGLPDASVDCVTSTATLGYIPEEDLVRILTEMHRILAPGGILSCHVDMSDLFSHVDRTITPWHFLRFSERAWRLVNPPLLYQNRLRSRTYVGLAESAGFRILEALPRVPAEYEFAQMPAPAVHPSFARVRGEPDFLATHLQLVCAK